MAIMINIPVNTVGRQPLPMVFLPKLPIPLPFALPFGLAELLLDLLVLDFDASDFGERFVAPLPFALRFSELIAFLAILPPDTDKKRVVSIR
jgi:hypothetical protein